MLDADGSGSLEADELAEAFQAVGIKVPTKNIQVKKRLSSREHSSSDAQMLAGTDLFLTRAICHPIVCSCFVLVKTLNEQINHALSPLFHFFIPPSLPT